MEIVINLHNSERKMNIDLEMILANPLHNLDFQVFNRIEIFKVLVIKPLPQK